ncbi:hypothetical protein ILYODFUR_035751 [Ilyodon furcidens]|uniref:Uncharacterized protein n=1 Tax=Ilyodon furcidens TaxID=33524 RepID=A0ABV0SSP7_9TELE
MEVHHFWTIYITTIISDVLTSLLDSSLYFCSENRFGTCLVLVLCGLKSHHEGFNLLFHYNITGPSCSSFTSKGSVLSWFSFIWESSTSSWKRFIFRGSGLSSSVFAGSCVSVIDTGLNWFRSYLSDWSFLVQLGNYSSSLI